MDAPELRVVPVDEVLAAFAKVTTDVTQDVIRALQEAVTSLRVELYAERDRAVAAENEVRELRAYLARRWWRRL
jgi:hypothetical protein